MKGQYLTLEYVIFFMIGIVLLVSVYYAFSDMNKTYKSSILQSQLQMSGNLISGAIVNVYQASNSTNSSINYTLEIPERLSTCIYSVNILNENLNLNCTNIPNQGVALPLYNLNIVKKNIIYSTNGIVKLYAKDGTVEIS
jgi:hypothetical protein